jgi:hypothetical protein
MGGETLRFESLGCTDDRIDCATRVCTVCNDVER